MPPRVTPANSRARRTLLAAFASCSLLACAARPVAAHRFTSRFESPIPLSLLFVGAGATVAATAASSDWTTGREPAGGQFDSAANAAKG